jgi:hypothetical protein
MIRIHARRICCADIPVHEGLQAHHLLVQIGSSRQYSLHTCLQMQLPVLFLDSLNNMRNYISTERHATRTYRFICSIQIPNKHESTTAEPTVLHT